MAGPAFYPSQTKGELMRLPADIIKEKHGGSLRKAS